MILKDIYNKLNEISPFELQESWDNSGLLVGDFNDKIDTIFLSLDVSLDMLKSLKSNSLLIVHHPLIFKPLKQIDYDNYISKIIREN